MKSNIYAVLEKRTILLTKELKEHQRVVRLNRFQDYLTYIKSWS